MLILYLLAKIYKYKRCPPRRHRRTALFLGLALFALPLFSLEIEQKIRKGHYITKLGSSNYIDWTEGKMYVTARRALYKTENRPSSFQTDGRLTLGEIRSKARRAVQKEAYLKLASLVYDLNFNSDRLIRDRMRQDERFRQAMGKLPSLFQIESRRTGAEYVSLRLSLSFWGSRGLYALLSDTDTDTDTDTYNERAALPVLEVKNPSLSISGLIFVLEDAGNFGGFQASLQSHFYSREGLLFYAPEMADPRYAVQRGLLVYYRSLEMARKDPRAGPKPYIAYVAALKGTKRSDFVVHDKDFRAILSSPSGPKVLRQCKVIVVIPSKD